MEPAAFCFGTLSVRKLKELAGTHGVDISSCLERSEIVDAIRRAGLREHTATPPSTTHLPEQTGPSRDHYDELSISQLKRVAKERGVDVSTCTRPASWDATLTQKFGATHWKDSLRRTDRRRRRRRRRTI